MTSRGHALSRDALVRTLTAYSGITTEDGAGDGTTLVDSNLIDNAFISPSGIPEKTILILSGDARGEDKGSASFNNGTGAITLQGTGFSAQIKVGTIFRILNISSIEIDVARIETKIDTINGRTGSIIDDYLNSGVRGLTAIVALINACGGTLNTLDGRTGSMIDDYLNSGVHGLAAITALVNACGGTLNILNSRTESMLNDYLASGVHGLAAILALINAVGAGVAAIKVTTDRIEGVAGVFHEQADAAFNVAVDDSENDIFDLSTASTRYIVRNLRLKSADPGAGETITIRLYELINDGATLVDSFEIDHDNYMTYFSLMDMFGLPQLAGDDIHVVAIGSASGPIAVTGQYSHAKTNN